ncbi:hypothetical protein [Peterkaempfera griseoplana]|uniref:hypothetical protein n=1 Tax=Peterkaempfera griseoplana TaxID=66896 RepID=UPI0012FEB83C|nr:hypothetical protein [Peterkaempfera griseoplana]
MYFRPRGAVDLRYLDDLRTDRNGHLDDRTTATADGTRAVGPRFDDLSHHLDSDKPTDHVDVR